MFRILAALLLLSSPALAQVGQGYTPPAGTTPLGFVSATNGATIATPSPGTLVVTGCTAAATVTVSNAGQGVVENQCSYPVTVTTAAGTGVVVAAGATQGVAADGTNVVMAPSDVSGANVRATNGTASPASTLAARFAERIDVRADFGAKGDGTTDDSAAIAAAFASANTRAASGTQIQVYFPGGRYVVKSTTLPTFTHGVQVMGDGRMTSEIIVDTAYTGAALLSWADTWYATPSNTGAGVSNIAINGNAASPNVQNAIVLYDHVDLFRAENVDVFNMTGRGLYAGVELFDTTAYTRESHFSNFRVFTSGQSGTPAVEVTTQCTSSCTGTDASNELDFDSFDIYAPAAMGFLIHNESSAGQGVRDIRIAHLRIEGQESYAGTGNLFQIGTSSQIGAVANISVTDSILLSMYTGYYALQTTASVLAGAPTNVFAHGLQILQGSNAGGGLNVQACSGCAFHMNQIGSAGTNVTVASSNLISSPLVIEADGAELQWTWTVDATVSPFLRTSNGNYGTPATNFVSAQQADSTTVGGNPRGVNSVDWQTIRFGGIQAATGQYSVISGGSSNRASNIGATVAGGNQNIVNGFNSVISGGALNVVPGGSYGTIPGGYEGSSLLNFGMFAYASGDFAAVGDAQWAVVVLRANTADTSAHRVLSDGTGTASYATGNTLIPSLNSVWAIDLTCLYFDTVSGAAASWSWPGVSLYVGASLASATVAAPTATAGQVHGTPGATAPTLSADTTNGGLSISFTAPNTDASRIVCRANIVVV